MIKKIKNDDVFNKINEPDEDKLHELFHKEMDKITYHQQLSILKYMHSKIINSVVDKDAKKGAEVLKELLNVKGNSQTILDPNLINEIINYLYTGMKIGKKSPR